MSCPCVGERRLAGAAGIVAAYCALDPIYRTLLLFRCCVVAKAHPSK